MGTIDMELAQSQSPDDKNYLPPESNGISGSGQRYAKDETVLARFGKKQQLRVSIFKSPH